jgi:hypothetical protein
MKTAVEFLIDEIIKLTGVNIAMDEPIIEQALELEKRQIIESFSLGIISHHDAFKNQNKWDNGEQYYNETFKK